MKVVITSAAGNRLFPHTHTKPKPMVYIAGKPIISHILDRIIELQPEKITLVVGYHKEQPISYIDRHDKDKFNIRYIDQQERLGLSHSVYVTKDRVLGSKIMIAIGKNLNSRKNTVECGRIIAFVHYLMSLMINCKCAIKAN